jgi:hypothetical protein
MGLRDWRRAKARARRRGPTCGARAVDRGTVLGRGSNSSADAPRPAARLRGSWSRPLGPVPFGTVFLLAGAADRGDVDRHDGRLPDPIADEGPAEHADQSFVFTKVVRTSNPVQLDTQGAPSIAGRGWRGDSRRAGDETLHRLCRGSPVVSDGRCARSTISIGTMRSTVRTYVAVRSSVIWSPEQTRAGCCGHGVPHLDLDRSGELPKHSLQRYLCQQVFRNLATLVQGRGREAFDVRLAAWGRAERSGLAVWGSGLGGLALEATGWDVARGASGSDDAVMW